MKMFLINLKIDIGVKRGVFMYNFYVSDGRMMVFNEGFVWKRRFFCEENYLDLVLVNLR